MTAPKPCPFCGASPEVGPPDDSRGGCWGYVACRNTRCPANLKVGDGEPICDERGRLAYIEAAVRRWNARAWPCRDDLLQQFDALANEIDAAAGNTPGESGEARAIAQTYWDCAERVRGLVAKLRGPALEPTHGDLITAVKAWCAPRGAAWHEVGRNAEGWNAEVQLADGRVLRVQGTDHEAVLQALEVGWMT